MSSVQVRYKSISGSDHCKYWLFISLLSRGSGEERRKEERKDSDKIVKSCHCPFF